MAKNGRPPLAEANRTAAAKLKSAHLDEYDGYVTEYLNNKGWAQATQTVTRWVTKTPETPAEGAS